MFIKNNFKSIARAVMAIFFIVVILAAWPLDTSAGEKPESALLTPVSVVKKATDDSGSFEKETANASVKKKRFPWLLAAAGAVTIGILVYFLVIQKPRYKLTVELAASVTGNLRPGIYTYKHGKNVHYNFDTVPGYSNLKVMLDEKEVLATGSIRMEKNHILKATAQASIYTLTVSTGTGVKGTPEAGTFTYLWNESVNYIYSVDEGYQNLKVLLDGTEAPTQGVVTMDRNHTLSVTASRMPQPDLVGSKWHITLVYSTGEVYEGTIHFSKTNNGGFIVVWDSPYPWPGSGTWSTWFKNGWNITFTGPAESAYTTSTKGSVQTAALGSRQIVECTCIFANGMSGTFNRSYDPDDCLPPIVTGHGIWSARRL